MNKAEKLATMADEYFEANDGEFIENFTSDIERAFKQIKQDTIAECIEVSEKLLSLWVEDSKRVCGGGMSEENYQSRKRALEAQIKAIRELGKDS